MANAPKPSMPEENPKFARDLNWGRSNTLVLAAGILLMGAGYLALWLLRRDIMPWLGRIAPISIMLGYVVMFASVLAGGDKNQPSNNTND